MKKNWLFIILIISGCSTIRITSTWKNADVSPKRYEPILVLGVMEDRDSNLCRIMEQRLTDDLRNLGYNAISSIAEYGPHAYDNIKEEETFKLFFLRGIGTVITVVLLDKVEEIYEQPLWMKNNPSWNEYSRMYQKRYTPTNFFVETNYFWETNLYDTNGFMILYSVQSQSFGSKPPNILADEYDSMILNDMVKKGVLQKQVKVLKAF